MSQDILQDFAAGPSVTLMSADVTDGNSSALTSSVDFGATAPVEFGYELILTTQASATSFAFLEVAWSHDNTDFSDTDNLEVITAVKCTASTDKKKVGKYPVMARYAQFRIRNESGGTIDGTSSNTALVLTDIAIDQA